MNFKNGLSLLTGLIFLIILACTPPPAEQTTDLTKVKEEVSAIATAWQNAINAKDLDAQMALFADDMKSFAPNESPKTSKAEIKTAMEEAMKKAMEKDSTAVGGTVEFITNEVFADGNLAVELGSWVDKDAEGNVSDKGNYFTVLEKRDGKYMIVRDIWNSEMPKKKPEPMADADEPETEE